MTEQNKQSTTADANDKSSSSLLPVGSEAPDFTLNAIPGEAHSLRELRGRPVVLVFYPADWSPVCGDQLALYNQLKDVWKGLRAQVVGVSVDGVWCHQAYSTTRNLSFPLLADFEPKGAVAQRYNAYNNKGGVAHRALYVLDANGIIQWNHLSPANINPGADGILKALESLTPEQRGESGATAPSSRVTQPAKSQKPEARA